MRSTSTPRAGPTANADALAIAEVVGQVLRNAESPGRAGREITRELRDLTGARAVLLLQYVHEHGGQGHTVVATSPSRRGALGESADVERLAELADDLVGPALWKAEGDGGEAQRILCRLGVGDSIVTPLTVGSRKMGCLMLLGIPGDSHGMDLVLQTLEMLSTTIALVFRNALLYEQQEATIAERSRELISSNKALHESEEYLRSVFRAAPIGIGVVVDRVFAQVNERMCEMTGYSEEELIGRDARMVYPSDEDDEHVGHEKYAQIRDHGTGTVETRWKRKDGRMIDVLLSSTPMDLNDLSKGLTFTALDITERKQTQEERLGLERQVLHAQKLESLGVLAGGIAHDFNNILTAILGNADLALAELSPCAPARGNVEEIERASKRAAELAKQMLAYSGKGRFVVEPIDLGKFVEEMAQLLEVSISKKAVLEYHCADNLPTFDGDATQIRQIIMNLITNASEAIGDESGVIALSAGAMDCDSAYLDDVGEVLRAGLGEPLPEGLYVYLEVADTGCGMDEATLAKVFDPFFTTKFAGRGLGLAAVLGIVRGHHGAIKIDSEVGKGTTVKVLFPAVEAEPAASRAQPRAAGQWRGSDTVLLADDEETVRAVGTTMLKRLGMTVIPAVDGREAIDILRERADEIDCVVLDLTMPRMGGEETFRELRRIRSDLPVIMSSGYTEEEVIQRFVGKGVAGFIQKPYDLEHLAAALSQVLDKEPTRPTEHEGQGPVCP